jgi:hypothetical protein
MTVAGVRRCGYVRMAEALAYCNRNEPCRVLNGRLVAILDFLRSDRAGTALARQPFVAGFSRVAAYQLNVFALI